MIEPALGHAAELFAELADLPPAERSARLAACRERDPALADEVAELLACHDRAENFLRSGDLREAAAELEETLPASSRLAGYTILGVLGTGGMGVVYVAEQERPRRTVALKLIRRGLGGRGMLRRFEHEAEVLGRLQHPGIAQIYEAGAAETGAGLQPYIAMELIRGLPLLEYAVRNGLDHRRRLALVAEVCDAVQHAHQRGFVHRDLKPGNILVDEEGRPKVLDFGIARATDSDLRINTLQTDVGQLIGTLAYMSPEQFSGNSEEVDTRADVYALGVILHEVLTGSLPLDVRGLSIAEVAALIRDQPPPRIGTADRSLRGDAETIVLKSLEKEKGRRYQTAAELGADIRRFLAGEAIEAKRDSAAYVLRKQIKKHRGPAALGALLLLALIVFAVVVSIQLQRNRALTWAERLAKDEALLSLDAARSARTQADAAAGRLREELTASNLEQGRLLGRAGNLAAAEDLIWPEFLRNPASPHAYWGLWELYWRMPCAATFATGEPGSGSVAFLAGNTAFATGGGDGRVALWDAGTLRRIRTLEGGGAQLVNLAASPTTPRVAASYRDGTVVVWDTETGERLRTLDAAASWRGLAYSPDGVLLAVGGRDGILRLWCESADWARSESPGTGSELGRMSIAADGTIAVVEAERPRVFLWSAGAQEPRVIEDPAGPIVSVAISPDGRLVATSGHDRMIRVWDAETLAPVSSFGGRNGPIMTLRFGADARTLLASGYWAVEMWDATTGERRLSMPSHMAVPFAAMSGDGRFVVAGTEDGLARLWDIAPDRGITRLGPHQGRTVAEFSRDGRLIATGDEAGRLRLWDAGDGALLAEVPAHSRRIRALHFQPAGSLLVTAADDRAVRLWDLGTGAMVGGYSDCEAISAWSCAFSGDGTRLAYARPDGSIVIRAVESGSELAVIRGSGLQVVSVRFTPDDSALVSIDRSYTIRVWGADGSELAPFERPAVQPWTVAFTPDGGGMIVGSWARTVEVWDFATRKRTAELRGHSALVARVELNPTNPDIAVSAGNDGAVRLWDIPSRRPLAAMEFFGGWDVTTASWAPDGRRLVVGGAEGTVAVIDPSAVERSIAGNASHHIARFRGRGEEFEGTARAEEWARRIEETGDAAPAAPTPGVSPARVRRWGARGG